MPSLRLPWQLASGVGQANWPLRDLACGWTLGIAIPDSDDAKAQSGCRATAGEGSMVPWQARLVSVPMAADPRPYWLPASKSGVGPWRAPLHNTASARQYGSGRLAFRKEDRRGWDFGAAAKRQPRPMMAKCCPAVLPCGFAAGLSRPMTEAALAIGCRFSG